MQFGKSLLAISIATILTACGGGSTDTATSDPQPAPAPPPAEAEPTETVVEGVITGFGSVYVNGKRYISDDAAFTIAGKSGAVESALKVGMVVKVKASQSDDDAAPEASEIVYEETLQGAVSVVDTTNATLLVMGQEVYFDDLTEFDGITPETLAVNDVLEISGFMNGDNRFYATFVKLETEETETKLTGNITQLNIEQQTFMLGELGVSYAQASFSDMTADDLVEGMAVKVEGVEFDPSTSALIAASVENKDDDRGNKLADTDEVSIAGMVTKYNSENGTFKLNRYDFVISAETEFEDGTLEDFTGNIWVKVEGQIQDDALVAEKIEFKKRNVKSKTEGVVSSVDTSTQTFVINDITFSVTEETQYKDESELNERRFTFDDIAVNDVLKVASKELADGSQFALKVKRIEEEEREGELKGAAEQVSADGLTLSGVSVLFSEETEFESDDGTITVEELLALIQENPALLIEVEGQYEATDLVAEKVKIELPDDEDDNKGRGAAGKRGKMELEGQVESVTDSSVTVAGFELRFNEESKLELNGETVMLEAFLAAAQVGSVLEFEGVWQDEAYILVNEAELESE